MNNVYVSNRTGPEERKRFQSLHWPWTAGTFSSRLTLKNVKGFTTYTGCEQPARFHHDWPWKAYKVSTPTLAVNNRYVFITTGPEERTRFQHLHWLWTTGTFSSRLALKSVQGFNTYTGCEQQVRFHHDWPWRAYKVSPPTLAVLHVFNTSGPEKCTRRQRLD